MQHTKHIFTVLVVCGFVSATWAQGFGAVTEQNEFGQVDYSQRMVRATGIGAVNPKAPNVAVARAGAITAARMDAYRRLLEAVKGVRVSSETTVRNSMVDDDVIRTQVDGMVKGARRVGDVKYLSDTSVEVTLEVPMSGIMEVLLPTAQPASAFGGTLMPPLVPTGLGGIPSPAPLSVTPAVVGQPITGLIVDTRGLGVKPSMSPRLITTDGTVIYGPGNYPRDFAVTQGVVGYHKDIAAAGADARVAGNPLTIKGVSTAGTLATDVVVSTADAQRAASHVGFADALSNCRVMFILD